MVNLDDINQIKKLDPSNVFGSTGFLMDQIKQISDLADSLNIDPSYSTVKNIVISGMGGSAYGGRVAESLFLKERSSASFKNSLKVPIFVNNDYTLPRFVNSDSLVILTSYSGGTEEVLSAFEDAKSKGAKILGLTSGGKLAQILKEHNLPVLTFDPKFNPSGQPRLGTGYIVMGTIKLLEKLGFINLEVNPRDLINNLNNIHESIKGESKTLAKSLLGQIPVIFTADFLAGNAHILRNQFNETAKTFSAYSPIPELNHHLMEGLKNPTDKKLVVLFLESKLFPQIIQKRISLTKDVVGQNNIKIHEYQTKLTSPTEQVFEVLLFGSYLTFYLAILYGFDPSLIPWVDYFKKQLTK